MIDLLKKDKGLIDRLMDSLSCEEKAIYIKIDKIFDMDHKFNGKTVDEIIKIK